ARHLVILHPLCRGVDKRLAQTRPARLIGRQCLRDGRAETRIVAEHLPGDPIAGLAAGLPGRRRATAAAIARSGVTMKIPYEARVIVKLARDPCDLMRNSARVARIKPCFL